MTYYQRSCIVEDYLNEFWSFISKTSYADLYTIVVKFHKDLYIAIQNQIAILPVDKPDDIDATWFEAM